MANILIVDDELLYQRLVKVNLEQEGYQVTQASDGESALDIISETSFDLIILDIMMPGIDGFETCERIRQFSNIPIIMLTAKGEENDRVKGLNYGADDYVIKPFSATELIARVKAVLRRAQSMETVYQSRYFSHQNLKIDFAKAEVWKDEKPIYLSATEYRLLIHFAHNIGKVLSAKDLLSTVWGESYKNDKEILWVSIARLRQKIEDLPNKPKHIVTRAGLGYIMPAED
ncbi:MAG: response regulator transcription factor [Anaerolineaceae bacterium]|nr:response regulator transcription factor [Anaerolineaceae bacterium]